jgi:hypothetical protein
VGSPPTATHGPRGQSARITVSFIRVMSRLRRQRAVLRLPRGPSWYVIKHGDNYIFVYSYRLVTHLRLMLRLRMVEAIPLLACVPSWWDTDIFSQ